MTTKHPEGSAGERAFVTALRLYGDGLPAPEREAMFHPSRKWRLDFLFVGRVAVEIDGGQWVANGGRHARDGDREKLNEAAAMGMVVLRFSPQQVERDPEACVALVRRALSGATAAQRRGVRVYDEQGALFAESVSAAARRIDCHESALYRYLTEHADGMRLTGRPHPANLGRRGARRHAVLAREEGEL